MSNPSTNPPTTKEQFRRRLGYYLVGLAIGCFMAGGLYYARKAQWQHEQELLRQAEVDELRRAEPGQTAPSQPSANPPPR